ncbi:DNA-(apurinic or apyrimidinic site) lyase [Ceratocystis pirilliformis]|uniref:DNA-(Apurinic or apyrimidinic site) lyase n=1 Tax=Ceratocystis pirilliformis TaxID=259994 RepID=A0ABR3ZBP9_9PEZI
MAPRKSTRAATIKSAKRKAESLADSEIKSESESESKPNPPKKLKAAPTQAPVKSELLSLPVKSRSKPKAQAKTKNADGMIPLIERTTVSTLKKAMYIGAHISAAGGVQNAPPNAVHIGANSFALFLKSQRKWNNPPLDPTARDGYISATKHSHYNSCKHVLPHGSYLVNLAQTDKAKGDQAYASFVDDLKRCDQLGILLYNFHPGSTGGESMDSACKRIAERINAAHKETKTVIPVLENMAGAGNVVGGRFEDLKMIIDGVEDKSRVAVCIDTCHAFAAGYDIRTAEACKRTFGEFDRVVGMKYLRAFHLNDSKAPFNSNRDLHANIGTGFIGLRAFHAIMNNESFCDMPMILETPIDFKDANGKSVENKQIWADEIKLLESLIGADTETDEFRQLEEELQARGENERAKIQDQVNRKSSKSGVKKAPAMKKPRGKKKVESDDDSG